MASAAGPAIAEAAEAVLVVDVGAAACRLGLSGAAAPALELPHGAGGLDRPYSYSEGRGLELCAEALESSLRAALKALDAAAQKGPLLLVEATQATAAARAAAAEVLFERLEVPKAFLARRAALSTYSHGQTTAAVLDVGASHSCAAAVLNGWVLPERVRDCSVGGDLLDRMLWNELKGKVQVSAPEGGGASTLSLAMARSLKESSCRLDEEETEEPTSVLLPDGARIELNGRGAALRSVPSQLLFEPSGVAARLRVRKPNCPGPSATYTGLSAMLADCADVGDEAHGSAVPRQFGRSVVLAGGGARLPSFGPRLQQALGQARGRLQRAMLDWRPEKRKRAEGAEGESFVGMEADSADLLAARELKHSAWTGGSILACLGTFEDFLVTRAEFQEVGVGIFTKKCP